jgi:membrane protein implicated in regulation of membrane protease activity
MFEGLEWKSAFKRAAIFVGLWLGLVYVFSVAFPESFGVRSGAELVSTLIFGVVFFFVYATFFAFTERRKKRRLAELKAQKKGKPGTRTGPPTSEDGEAEPGGLKGRHNPNTSRRKASRRRRR